MTRRAAGRIGVKRVYEEASADDGCRVLVDRIWPRGVAKSDAGVERWLKEVAPSTALRRWFAHDPQKWDKFREKYARELKSHEEELGWLLDRAIEGRLTLVYSARDEDHNQAVALREILIERFKRA